MDWRAWRRQWLTEPLYRKAGAAMPRLSATEQEAIDAGDVWWDAQLFSGQPDWQAFFATPPAALTAQEQAFLDGPVAQLCAMLDDWDISWNRYDLPPQVWSFLKDNGFFGMIIPRQYGGLGFSAYAHSEVVSRISVRSVTCAVTVMVPNSLGPGELLLQFGTQEQRDYWLPRLAQGQEIPSFGLTSPEAGSDAAAMTDTGVVCKQMVDGVEELGIRLNWGKRYITLSPVATVLGLAFKLLDPDHLIGSDTEVGISVALVPTNLPGITIGRRHLPSMQAFQNGPNQGKDVFVPISALIGGVEKAGQGWAMLMSALAAGRGISLPSLSSAACMFAAHTAGAYARVRTQFGIPIGKFEGIQEKLGRMAANAYLVEAARRFTCAGLDQGYKPSVVSAIMKLHATERMRQSVNDAMDVHAGKAVIDGPSNYLGGLYRALPVGITVEGANILTRNLIVFGQGAIRAHPYLMQEVAALGNSDQEAGEAAFDAVIWKHLGHSTKNALRAIGHAWTKAVFAKSPVQAGLAGIYYRRLGRYAAAFSLVSELTLLTLGGSLKRREMLSARLGDVLAELFLLSAVLKRWHDEGQHESDLPLVRWCAEQSFFTIERRLNDVLFNFPARGLAIVLRFLLQPPAMKAKPPSDQLTATCADILLEPSESRDRLVGAVWTTCNSASVEQLEYAFEQVVQAQPILDRLKHGGLKDWRVAHAKGALTDAQAQLLERMQAAVAAVVNVDDFAPDAFARKPA
ncbi:acyl-CoA dehydrogenase [Eoetvoesiella caeni]|uniref:Acyl-coenzyme A dehydrogenase n=1 Tax=Eoetvoesiella caeni TaxID=645616 RepID=A0A366HA78_9BURK|nr:acyl-CoA dehydrogenase [Eoetvoesiella caeni]MCI2809508.1 acyl-CoA dehydrogenase [Eoetvoesiella caeni]NYT56004.1 acyl-CoA dehydrogenase [Eoetvoesiella caeni]RBP38767.1 acyl-CoA dehydrogenase [Eoetvoesiella caeni]